MSTWALMNPKDFLRRCFAFAVVGEAGAPCSITCIEERKQQDFTCCYVHHKRSRAGKGVFPSHASGRSPVAV